MSQIKKNTADTKEKTSPTGASKKPGSPTGSAATPARAASPTSPNAPPSALRNANAPSNQSSSISFKDSKDQPTKDQPAKDQSAKDSSPDLRPAAQQRLATRRSLSSAISPATFSLERDLAEARNKIQHLDGECERMKHQITNLKQDVKRSHASLFDMTSLKNQLAAQVEDLMLEKEDLRQQVLNAGMKHTLELQDMNLRVMDIQKSLEKKDAEMVNQENIVMALRAEVERLRQGGGKSQTSASRFKSPRTGNAEGEEEVQNTHVKAIRLEMANVQLAEQVEKLQATNSDHGITISNLRQENTSLKEDLKRMKAFIANAGLVMPGNAKGKEEQVSSGTPTFICIEEAKAKQQFAIERDALQSLIAEGLTLFEELYNAHRVMRRNAMDDVDKATHLWLGLSASQRRSSISPQRPGVSPNRRDSSAVHSSSMLGKSPDQSANPQPKIYVMSWYKGKGPDMLQSWLAHSSNIFSPALVQALMSNGFSDMQAISRLTEEDLAAMCVTAGVRRKVLSAVEELNQKLAVVQQETQTMLRESFSLSPSYYEKEGKADAAEEEAEDDNEAGGVPGLKANQRRRRRKNCYSELSELLNELQNWFADAKVAIDAQGGAVDRIFTLSTVEGENH